MKVRRSGVAPSEQTFRQLRITPSGWHPQESLDLKIVSANRNRAFRAARNSAVVLWPNQLQRALDAWRAVTMVLFDACRASPPLGGTARSPSRRG